MKMKDRKPYGYDDARDGFKNVFLIVIVVAFLAFLTMVGN